MEGCKKKLYSPGWLTLHSLKMDNALKRTLMASVVRTSMLISTAWATLVVPGLLWSSPVKFSLKINTSKKFHLHHAFAKCSAMLYLREGRSKPSSFLTLCSISCLLSSSLSALQLQESTFPQREQMETFAFARKFPVWTRSKWPGRDSSLDKMSTS